MSEYRLQVRQHAVAAAPSSKATQPEVGEFCYLYVTVGTVYCTVLFSVFSFRSLLTMYCIVVTGFGGWGTKTQSRPGNQNPLWGFV